MNYLKKELREFIEKHGYTESDILVAFNTMLIIFEAMTSKERKDAISKLFKIPPKKQKRIVSGDKSSSADFSEIILKNWHRPTIFNPNTNVSNVSYNLLQIYTGNYLEGLSLDQIKENFDSLFGLDHLNNLHIYYTFTIALDEKNLLEGASFSFKDYFLKRVKERDLEKYLENQIIDTLEMQVKILARVKGVRLNSSWFHNLQTEYVNDMEQLADLMYKEKLEEMNRITLERNQYADEIRILKQELEQKDSIIKELNETIALLKAKLDVTMKFKGRRVVLIGDPQNELKYGELIEGYGGIFRFFDATEINKIASSLDVIKNADYVFHVTAYGGHDVHYTIRDFDNIYHVNERGLQGLINAIEGL